MKAALIALMLAVIISGGLYFSYMQDQDRHAQQMFKQVMAAVANLSPQLEQSYTANQQFSPQDKPVSLSVVNHDGVQTKLSFVIQVEPEYVLISIAPGETLLADSTVLLEPVLSEGQVRWKCLGGDLLLRYRSKACKVGDAIRL